MCQLTLIPDKISLIIFILESFVFNLALCNFFPLLANFALSGINIIIVAIPLIVYAVYIFLLSTQSEIYFYQQKSLFLFFDREDKRIKQFERELRSNQLSY